MVCSRLGLIRESGFVQVETIRVDIPVANEINSLETPGEGNLNDCLANLRVGMDSDLSACLAFTSDIPTALFAPFWITKSPGSRSTNSESML